MSFTPMHLGALHPVEQLLTVLLAFGPFVLLAVVVVVRRRADDREERQQREAGLEEPAQRER